MKTKRFFAMLLAVVTILGCLAGCASSNDGGGNNTLDPDAVIC